jgi:hypothetical protein
VLWLKAFKIAYVLIFLLLSATIIANSVQPTLSAKPKILIIGEKNYYYDSFIKVVSAYGQITWESDVAANVSDIDFLRQFDLFVCPGGYESTSAFESNILTCVKEGKSLLSTLAAYGPAIDLVTQRTVNTSDSWADVEIVNNSITAGVNNIKLKGSSTGIRVLDGGQPLLLTPKLPGYPDPQEALAVYGNYYNGKYAVIVSLFNPALFSGDVSTLTGNMVKWLTNQNISAPPENETNPINPPTNNTGVNVGGLLLPILVVAIVAVVGISALVLLRRKT